MCSGNTLATLTKAFNTWMLEMPINEAANFTLMDPRSTWLSQSGWSGGTLQAQFADKRCISPDNDHREQIGHHGDIH